MLRGDEWAFRTVYRSVHPVLLRYVSVLVGPVDAEDVASEAWGQAFRDLSRFEGDADGFRGWITTIARHRGLDHLRARGRRPVADIGLEILGERPDPVDVETETIELLGTDRALAMIRSLPMDQAEAIMLRVVMGLDAATAGAVLGKRPGAVRSAAHRGLKTLSRTLGAGTLLSSVTLSTLVTLRR